jgi:hypothetical protein
MKFKILLVLCYSFGFSAFSQKVDLDKFKFGVKYQALPIENVPIEKRTFNVTSTAGTTVKSFVDENEIKNKLRVIGWKRAETEPTVNINLDLIEFSLISNKMMEDVNEEKDKAGKVLSRTVKYYVTAEYLQDGRVRITGPFSPPELSVKEKEAQKAKEEKVATNRFLAKTTLNGAPKTEVNYRTENLPSTRNYTSEKFESSSKAVDYFKVSQSSITESLLREFVNSGINKANYLANYYFGFATADEDTDHLWILDSKSHPEYQTQLEAIQAIKMLFGTMKANEPLGDLEENLQPLIDYFESLKTKYAGDDKWNKKMRYSAFFNLSKIYYYLDRPALAIIQADGLIANDYDTKDGERLKKEAQGLLDLFNKTKFTTRHNIPNK